MRELTYLRPRRVEWRSVPEPRLGGPREALVRPQLAEHAGAPVIVTGGGARSIGLYAVGLALALGSSRVTYVDHHPERLAIAERLGAGVIEASRGARWFDRHAPRIHGDHRIGVEASSTVAGLRYVL